jgi:hypothetical protein
MKREKMIENNEACIYLEKSLSKCSGCKHSKSCLEKSNLIVDFIKNKIVKGFLKGHKSASK